MSARFQPSAPHTLCGLVLVLALVAGLTGCGDPAGATTTESRESDSGQSAEARRVSPAGPDRREDTKARGQPTAKERGSRDAGSAEESAVLVEVGDFERGPISSTLRVFAKLEARRHADVYAEVTGIVRETVVREGDAVSRGDPIVLLDDRELRLQADASKILWEQNKSRVSQAELAIREQEQTVRSRELAAEKALTEFNRVKALFSDPGDGLDDLESIISREEYDAKRYAYEEARGQHESAKIELERTRVDFTLAQQVERQSEIDYQKALFQLSRASLASPLDGVITFLELKPGEPVSPSKLAFSVVDPGVLEARLFVPQAELARLRPDQDVRIVCEVFPDRVFHGAIEVIHRVVDAENGMVRVVVAVTDPSASGFLRPGMFINGEIILEKHSDALLVRKKAILYESQQPVLFLARDGVARRYAIDVGFSEKDRVEVLALRDMDGEPLGDIPEKGALVLQGHNNLKDGSPVELLTAHEPAEADSISEKLDRSE